MLHIKIVTPERTVLEEDAASLTCPTTTGQITILPNHEPLVSTLQPGELIAHVAGIAHSYAVSGGFVEVRPGSQVVVLADSAEHAAEIDADEAALAKQRAEADMARVAATRVSDEEYAMAAANLQHSLIRVDLARRTSHRASHGVGSQSMLEE